MSKAVPYSAEQKQFFVLTSKIKKSMSVLSRYHLISITMQ